MCAGGVTTHIRAALTRRMVAYLHCVILFFTRLSVSKIYHSRQRDHASLCGVRIVIECQREGEGEECRGAREAGVLCPGDGAREDSLLCVCVCVCVCV